MTHQDNMSNPNDRITVEEINEILEQYDRFIHHLARKNIPRSTIRVTETDMEIDDLTQNIRLKLWQALQKRDIRNIKSYIRVIARNESVNMVRQHKPVMPLITDNDGEPPQSSVVVAAGQEMHDPTENIEVDEMLANYAKRLPGPVLKLPPQQQHAMICALKDQIADLLPLVAMFRPHGIDVESLDWPEAESELRSSRVSLSIARKKMRDTKKDIAW